MAWSPSQRREHQQERLRYIRDYKMDRGCTDCGYRARPEALDLDHLPGTSKAMNPSRLANRLLSYERIDAELAKCEVVCANCHRARTFDRLAGTLDPLPV